VENLKLCAILEGILARLNTLATDHGWYEPELQGEALYLISEIDNPEIQSIVKAANNDHEPDIIEQIDNIARRTR
jgi:hypothetical protein